MEKKPDKLTSSALTGSGSLAFEHNAEVEEEITACLQMVRQMKTDYQDQPEVLLGLNGVEEKIQGLRGSTAPDVLEKLDGILRMPVGTEGQTMRLDAFRKSAAKSQLENKDDYLKQVSKIVRNTINNSALLMLHFGEEDPNLGKLVSDLQALDLSSYKLVKRDMPVITQSPSMWKYNERKKTFLSDWLKPYEKELGMPISQMSDQDFVKALRKVENLRNTKLEEMTHLMVDVDRAAFRPHNRTMNPLVNGRDETFWGGDEGRTEFLNLVNKLITRFSFNLEDRFLIFRTKDGGFAYLVGFSDEAFDQAQITEDGKFALYPHLKVFLKMGDGEYSEITMEFYNRNAKTFYSSLKTSVMPFLHAAAVMVEEELSDSLKGAFDMWG